MTETIAPYDVPRPTPVPSTAVTSVPAPQQSMAGPEALAATGQINERMAQETDQYALHLDTLQAQDALNRLRAKREELTFGDQGFTKIKGGDVIKPNAAGEPMLDSFKNKFQAVSDDIGRDLSPRARQMFDPHAGAEKQSFLAQVGTHQITETEHFGRETLKGGLAQDQAEASRSFSDPAVIDQMRQRSEERARKYALSQGMSPEAADAAALAAGSNIVSVAIKSLLATGAQRQALAYFDANHDKLDANDRIQIGNAIKSVADNITAENRAAEAVVKAGGTPGPTDDTSAPQYLQRGRSYNAGGQPNPNNIGNVRPVGSSTGFQQPPSFDEGVALAVSNVRAYQSKFNGGAPMTLLQVGQRWAPKGDGANDPAQWAKNVAAGGGLPVDRPLNFNDPDVATRFARGVHTAEWGRNRPLDAYAPGVQLASGGAPSKAAEPAAGEPFPGASIQGATLPLTAPTSGKRDIQGIYSAAQLDVLKDTSLNTQEKARTLAILSREGSALGALQTAQVATLDDQVGASTAAALLNPKAIVPGMFSDIADRYAALGQSEKAITYRTLASMEGTLRDGLGAASDAQLEILKALTHGLPKRLIEAFMAGNAKSRAEELTLATETFAQIHKSVEEGIAPSALTEQAKKAIGHFVNAGKGEKAREVADYMTSAHNAHRMTTGGSTTEADQAIANLTATANEGHATTQQLQQLTLATSIFNRQRELLKQDPFKNGATVYADKVGQVPPLNFADPENEALVVRAGQARQIAALTGNPAVIPFSNEEIAQLKATWESAPPAQQQMMVSTLGKQLSAYPDMIPHVAAAIAGKGVSDPISQSLAAALSFHGEGDPAKEQVGNKILRGAGLRKAGDPGIRKIATQSDAWLQNWQDQTSTVFGYMAPEARDLLHNAIVSYVVNEMDQSGRQAEKLDTDVMNKAIHDVAGTVLNFRGQPIIAPTQDMTRYQMEALLNRLQPGDIPPNLHTREGDPITLQDIKTKALLGTVGTGVYKVLFSDPRNRGIPGEVADPRHQDDPQHYPPAFLIDLRPLLVRGQQMTGEANRPDYVTGVPSLAPKRPKQPGEP